MDELGLFTLALGLTKPWRVSDLKFSKEESRLDLWIDFVKGVKFPCPACDRTPEGEVHDTQDRTWRHLNFFQYECQGSSNIYPFGSSKSYPLAHV